MSFVIDLGPFFKRVNNAIQRINQWINVKKTYCAIHRITIYPVDSVIQPTQEKQRAICDVSTRTCYNSGAIEKFMLLKRSATKKKQWDREGESGFWPGYIYSASVIFWIIPFLLLPSGIHRQRYLCSPRHFTVYCYLNVWSR